MKFMDGTPVPEDYQKTIAQVVSFCCAMEEKYGADALEEVEPYQCSTCNGGDNAK